MKAIEQAISARSALGQRPMTLSFQSRCRPFLDGNGRVGRLLITMLLSHEKVLRESMLYMSLHFKRHHQEYYERLQRVRTHGDWEGWMDFFLDGVASVALAATAAADTGISAPTIRRVLREMQKKGILREITGRTRGQVFLYHPFIEALHDGL